VWSPDGNLRGTIKDICSSYLSSDVRDDVNFKEKLRELRKNPYLQIYVEANLNVCPENADLYVSMLKKHTESEPSCSFNGN